MDYGFKQFLGNASIDNEIIDLYLNHKNLTVNNIAQFTERSEAEIYRILHANSIQPNRVRVNHQKVQNLAHLGWDIPQIAEFTGYTTRNVRYILNKMVKE